MRYPTFIQFFYKILSNNLFTRRYIQDIRHIYEIIKPTTEPEIIRSTIHLFLKNLLVSIIILSFSLSFREITLYYYIIIFSVVFLLNSQMIQSNLEKEERKILKQFEKYLGDVRHFYHKNNMVEEAIFDSLESADYEISLHMGKIYDILEQDKVGEFETYREISPNKYFTTFLALCQITIQYGDTIQDQESLFLSNLNHLKNEVNIELLKREKLNYVFSGLLFLTILPVFFLKIIENWCLSNLPELEKYFMGSYGIIVSIVIFFSTILSYSIISRLKGHSHIYSRQHIYLEKISSFPLIKEKIQNWIFKNAKKAHKWNHLIRKSCERITLAQLLVQQYVLFFFSFLLLFTLTIQIIVVSKDLTLNYTKDFNGTAFMAKQTMLQEARDLIQKMTNTFYKEKNKVLLKDKLIYEMKQHTNSLMKQGNNLEILSEEIIKRIQSYQTYRFYWYYPILLFFISYMISKIPLFILECRCYFMKMSMEDEVLQFHSIIIMLMPIGKMNVYIILDWLENFSELFKTSLMECVDQFSFNEELALEELKEKEPFLPFVRIIENLEACDSVGVRKAFDEILGQRNYYIDKRKQDNEIMISNKGVIGKAIAYIPLTLTLGLYLIIPFVLESLTQLMKYVQEFNI